jgi:hypothetical protein
MDKSKITELANRYTWQLMVVVFFIVVMWLNTNYLTVASFDEYEVATEEKLTKGKLEIDEDLNDHTLEYNSIIARLQALEFLTAANKAEIVTLERRLQIYIDRYGDLAKEIDVNENNIIRLQTKVEYLENN